MSETCKTVIVKGNKGQPLIINESDYDESKYELFDKEKSDSYDKQAAKEFLTDKGVSFPNNISEKKLKELVQQTENTLSIVSKDGGFVIVNGKDEQVGDNFYASEKEAQEMLKLFTGK